MDNYWGNALTAQKCFACECSPLGTYLNEAGQPKQCDLEDGHCQCKPNVKNRDCNECRDGYWNIKSGDGCEECRCNPLGSYNESCDATSGQCFCRPGVGGVKCDTCLPNWYGYSEKGCKRCECDPAGSVDQQCDDFGRCRCHDVYAGSKCNKCVENRYNFTSGCLKCDDCYNLVQKRVNNLRDFISSVQIELNKMIASGLTSTDESMRDENAKLNIKLQSLKLLAKQLHDDIYEANHLKSNYEDSFVFLRGQLDAISKEVKIVDAKFEQFNAVFMEGEYTVSLISSLIETGKNQLSFIHEKNQIKSDQLDVIKAQVQEHNQNENLQTVAKQSREAADFQQHQVDEVTSVLDNSLSDARHSIDNLNKLANALEKEKAFKSLQIDYEKSLNDANSLMVEARTQKILLDKQIDEAEQSIQKLAEFKIPEVNFQMSDEIIDKNRIIIDTIDAQV